MNTYGIEKFGIINPKAVYRNLPVPQLVEHAVARGEGTLSKTGALVVTTGQYTGRSPDDRFVIDYPSIHDEIAWSKVNVPMSPEKFDQIFAKVTAYLQNREIFLFDGFAGADPSCTIKVRVINELASQNLFIRNLLLRPEGELPENFEQDLTIIAAPGFKCVPAIDGTNSEAAILFNVEKKMVVICGSQYSGEIKKSVFSYLNYALPHQNIFPMHCSANMGENGDTAVFFGLSGTGKTTLSADPSRKLIGDDEHGWSSNGVFNFEGGCYAKCINLSEENEPQIWNAIKFGALVENVVMDPETREFDFDDGSLTDNTRVGYPIDFIPNAAIPGIGSTPKTVIFLTADAFGVLPPVAKLDKNMAMYHFISGYTSKLAGTERGVKEPQSTFSSCFGAPFLPLDPSAYAEQLGKKLDEHPETNVYLVNTGWSGGPYGVGKRMSIKLSRAIVAAALNGELAKVEYELDPIFNFLVPTSCPGVDSNLLKAKNTWADKDAYDKTAKDLASQFAKNIKKFTKLSPEIVAAGPKAE